MAGQSLASQGITSEIIPSYFLVKEAAFQFNKFPGVDTILGLERKLTDEVMGVGKSFEEAFVKSQLAASVKIPTLGKVFISVNDSDKSKGADVARDLYSAGFAILATRGTASVISAAGIPVVVVNKVAKVAEGRPSIVDMIKNKEFF